MRTRIGMPLAIVGALLVFSLTLWPSSDSLTQEIGFWCLLCGERGLADGILNLLLFVPLGMGLALTFGPGWAVIGAAFLSGFVELAQTGLDGRFPAVADILFNTTGGLCGTVLVAGWTSVQTLAGSPTRLLKALALLLTPALFLVTAVLTAPHFPDTAYYGQWTTELGTLAPYPGRVLGASVGGVFIPNGRIPDQGASKASLQQGQTVSVTMQVGPRPSRATHLFAIFDDRRQEVLLLVVNGQDLDVSRGTLSSLFLLDRPGAIWPGGVAAEEGDTLEIHLRQEARSFCVDIGTTTRCDLFGGVEGGWRLLHQLGRPSGSSAGFLGIVWLMALSLPGGLTARTRAQAIVVGVGFGLSGWFISWWTPWMFAHWWVLFPPILGALSGHLLFRRLGRSELLTSAAEALPGGD